MTVVAAVAQYDLVLVRALFAGLTDHSADGFGQIGLLSCLLSLLLQKDCITPIYTCFPRFLSSACTEKKRSRQDAHIVLLMHINALRKCANPNDPDLQPMVVSVAKLWLGPLRWVVLCCNMEKA